MGRGRRPVPGPGVPTAAVVEALGADPERGLSDAEARRRLAEHGPNELPHERPPSAFAILLRQFKDVMVLVLLAGIALSAALGHRLEAAAIAVITAFTVLLGFVQEVRAQRSMEALRRLSAPRATVLRDGRATSVETLHVVPGDLLLLAQGDIVAADARLVEAADLQVAEASLTGESVPVSKDAAAPMAEGQPVGDRAAMVHASTVVTFGRARAVVTATGTDTELGRIGQLLASVEPDPTPLQRQLARLARWLLWAGAAAVAVIVALGLLRGEPLGEMVLFGIAVAVAVVPEALPAVVTISLAIGAQRMARRKALVRRLPTVETLGGTTVICSDKTGTLTTGQMAATAVVLPGQRYSVASAGYQPTGDIAPGGPALEAMRELARAAALCNDASLRQEEGGAWAVQGDPTEGALLVLAAKAGVPPEEARRRWPRQAELPFSSERKRMTTLHAIDGATVAYAKGAPETILAACKEEHTPQGPVPLDEARRQHWRATADAMAAEGLRVLALARRAPATRADAESGMQWLGLVGLQDAPRPEARDAIRVCKEAGIRPVMITGDHPLTARAIAADLGILAGGAVLSGTDLEALSDAELSERVAATQVYARVSPEHKLRIVTALQGRGEVVAMTGDGVNDAPALRKADLGIAMGITGTDVAKEAAGMALADDNFATIVAAVEEGRAIFQNIRKYLMFLLSTNFGEILLIAITMAAGLPLPLTAVQILYVNLASDGLPALALAVDPHDRDLMRRAPRKRGQSILEGGVVPLMLLAGVLSGLANVGVFLWAQAVGRPMEEAMTMVFVSLVLIQLAKAYVFRSQERSILERPFSNRWLNLAVAWEMVLLALLVYVPFLQGVFGTRPMGLVDWSVILGSAASVVLLLEFTKWGMRLGKRARAAR